MFEDQFTTLSAQSCPYCGERISLVVEASEETQEYIEDCEVCCRPLIVVVDQEGGVSLKRDDE